AQTDSWCLHAHGTSIINEGHNALSKILTGANSASTACKPAHKSEPSVKGDQYSRIRLSTRITKSAHLTGLRDLALPGMQTRQHTCHASRAHRKHTKSNSQRYPCGAKPFPNPF